MKIVDRKTFLALPADTVFTEYDDCYFGPLSIKGDSITHFEPGDFYEIGIANALAFELNFPHAELMQMAAEARRAGKSTSSIGMDFDCHGRDGLFEEDQLYAVWEDADVRALIAALQRSLLPVMEDGDG